MSPSGKICVDWYDYEQALIIYNKMKDLWKEPYKSQSVHIIYHFEFGDLKEDGGLTDKQFLSDYCKPIYDKYYQIGYKGLGTYIGTPEQLEQEKIDAKENDILDDLTYDLIMISDFELSLLPEFEGV